MPGIAVKRDRDKAGYDTVRSVKGITGGFAGCRPGGEANAVTVIIPYPAPEKRLFRGEFIKPRGAAPAA